MNAYLINPCAQPGVVSAEALDCLDQVLATLGRMTKNSRQNISRHRPRRKMAMTNFVSTFCLVLLCSAILLGSTLAAAQESGLDGTYVLDETDSDNMNEVIANAVGKLNFPTREIARGRLKKLNPTYRMVAITSSPTEISVTVDNQPPLRTPAKGAPVVWVGPDGGNVNASMQLAGRRLLQTFTSADGRRVNDYTLSPDGRTLTMQVTETSPRLSHSITYKQVYRRVPWKGMPTDLLPE